MTDTPGGSTHLHQPSQITLRIPVLPPISPSSPLSSLPPSPMSSPGSPLTPPPALTPPSPQASPSPPPAPAPALKIKLKAPQAEETASGPSAAGASSGAGSRRKRKSGLAEDTRRKRGKSDATDAVDAADAAIEDALDEPTPKRAAKAKPPPAKKARVRGKEGKTKDASTPVVGGESAKGEDVVMAEEAKDSLESISESRRVRCLICRADSSPTAVEWSIVHLQNPNLVPRERLHQARRKSRHQKTLKTRTRHQSSRRSRRNRSSNASRAE